MCTRKPTHPGAILREDVLPALGITKAELARRLGVTRKTVSALLNEKQTLSPDMAIRLGRLLNTTPQSWLNMQIALDLWGLERQGQYDYIQSMPHRDFGVLGCAQHRNR